MPNGGCRGCVQTTKLFNGTMSGAAARARYSSCSPTYVLRWAGAAIYLMIRAWTCSSCWAGVLSTVAKETTADATTKLIVGLTKNFNELRVVGLETDGSNCDLEAYQ